jgi:hypothetical protein
MCARVARDMLDLKTNTELTRAVRAMTLQLHDRLMSESPGAAKSQQPA